ncbi:hypothetical protein COV19_07200 [Candidatus Woesearchaeota archaeon CG10_big_fil_rev_8_21_14_0_10_44_13]|nr:MAG: hypothetical protein COV19_07200 [Candidatus Woesearchaeota archaeon CG10_big_fil_rev_8_21_14_0_10_44_13]
MEEWSKKRLRREKARLKLLKKEGLIKEEAGDAAHASNDDSKPEHHAHARPKTQGFVGKIRHLYEHDYKKLLFLTLTVLLLAIAQIGYQMATTGDFINKGVSLKGGITVTVPSSDYDFLAFEKQLRDNFKGSDIGVRKFSAAGTQSGLLIEADITDKEDIDNFENMIETTLGITKSDYSIEMVGSSLGASFFKEILMAIFFAFVFMAITVFLYFRVPIPSLLVSLAAFSTITSTIAVVNLIGMKISTAGIAAYLMLIGYSVDTDILLTTRVLRRREGTIMDGVYSALKTGLTMTLTTVAAVGVALIFSKSEVLRQIMIIIMIGLVFDIFYTWIQNVTTLRMYLEKRPEKGEIKQDV